MINQEDEAEKALAAFNKSEPKIKELLEALTAAKRVYLAIIERSARGDRVAAADWRRVEDKITELTRASLRLRLVLQRQAQMIAQGREAEIAAALIARITAALAPTAGCA
ncbi:hypothetical protein [Acidocella facilis]|uniref:hypothetical protein n=1 Tax=Acidocella facilis TaxID=525 RepID=UPI001F46E8DF|nr:hypothetical protein [Acidocella facilis]